MNGNGSCVKSLVLLRSLPTSFIPQISWKGQGATSQTGPVYSDLSWTQLQAPACQVTPMSGLDQSTGWNE